MQSIPVCFSWLPGPAVVDLLPYLFKLVLFPGDCFKTSQGACPLQWLKWEKRIFFVKFANGCCFHPKMFFFFSSLLGSHWMVYLSLDPYLRVFLLLSLECHYFSVSASTASVETSLAQSLQYRFGLAEGANTCASWQQPTPRLSSRPQAQIVNKIYHSKKLSLW